MSNEIVPTVYKWVIDDVIEKMANDFALLGVDESILIELQQSWEQKLLATKVAAFPDPSSFSSSSLQQQNPLDGEEEIDVAEEFSVYPPNLPPQMTEHHHSSQHGSIANDPSSMSNQRQHSLPSFSHPSQLTAGGGPVNANVSGLRQGGHASGNDFSAYYQLNQTDGSPLSEKDCCPLTNPLQSKFNLPHTCSIRSIENENENERNEEEQIQHKNIDETEEIEIEFMLQPKINENSSLSIKKSKNQKILSQLDGLDDDDDEDDDLDDDDEGNIDSDLDDEDSEEEIETDHIILCQYEKVSRIKNKWKALLRDGIMTINGKDYLFNKASGDFEW